LVVEIGPSGFVAGALALTSPGVAQTVTVQVIGDVNYTACSTVTVGIAVTQAK
jgi:hypothetical protein